MSSHGRGDIGLAIGLTFAAGLSTVIGASFAFCVSPEYVNILPISLAFSAGVMIYVSFIEIISEAQVSFEEELHDQENHVFLAHLYTSATFFGGVGFGYLLDYIVHATGYSHVHVNGQSHPDNPKLGDHPHHNVPNVSVTQSDHQMESTKSIGKESGQIELPEMKQDSNSNPDDVASEVSKEAENRELIKTSLITALAIGLHNFPEGLATFASTLADPTLGVSIAVAIAIHNIPEGVAVAMPIYFATGSKLKAFAWSFISGIAEPVGGLVGYAIIKNMFGHAVFGVLFGFTAGIMIYISFRELLPTARRKDLGDKYTTVLVFMGFLVMDISLILFELA